MQHSTPHNLKAQIFTTERFDTSKRSRGHHLFCTMKLLRIPESNYYPGTQYGGAFGSHTGFGVFGEMQGFYL